MPRRLKPIFSASRLSSAGSECTHQAGFETLVKAGYQPEIAYFECLHELKLIVALMYRGGLNYMHYSVSDTAEHRDYTGGSRIITDRTRQTMPQVLKEIQDGTYAQRWIEENESRREWFEAMQQQEQEHQIEQVGACLRSMMKFLKPVEVRQRNRSPVPASSK